MKFKLKFDGNLEASFIPSYIVFNADIVLSRYFAGNILENMNFEHVFNLNLKVCK